MSQLWSPVLYQSALIENVQNKFARYLAFKEDDSYPTFHTETAMFLSRFGLITFGDRMIVGSNNFIFNLLHSIDCPLLLNKINILVPFQLLSIAPSRLVIIAIFWVFPLAPVLIWLVFAHCCRFEFLCTIFVFLLSIFSL